MAINSINTVKATIQMRHGRQEDFDPDQMTAGEWAVSTDVKYVWMCFRPGLVRRMATYEAFEKDMEEIRAILVEARDIQTALEKWNKLAESYAHGGTGEREGEDTDNAKYYSEQAKIYAGKAESVANIGIMTTEKAGIGKPDGKTITADEDGTLRVIGGGGSISVNTKENAGYVTAGDGHANQVWGTDEEGNPGWRDEKGSAAGDFASKAIYGDDAISLGRLKGSGIEDNSRSIAYGFDVVSSGIRSTAFGYKTEASGANSFSAGNSSVSSGVNSFSAGNSNVSSGVNAASFGAGNIAYEYASFCAGNNLKAVEDYSFAEGCGGISAGYGSHVEGAQNISGAKYVLSISSVDYSNRKFTFDSTYDGFSDSYSALDVGSVLHVANERYINTAMTFTIESVEIGGKSVVVKEPIPTSNFTARMATIVKYGAGNSGSHAEGVRTYAKYNSHAEGRLTEAIGYCSHTEGYETKATNNQSHAEGHKTVASGGASHAEGSMCAASGDCSHAEGIETTASGNYSHAEGNHCKASGSNSHAEGSATIASGITSHAEGYNTQSNGSYSHAEGRGAVANGDHSHAEGWDTVASESSSHAEGWNTEASGDRSHAEGESTKALGNASHSEGVGTVALLNQHAQGHYNNSLRSLAPDSTQGTSSGTAFVIGNGTPGSTSNAARIDYNGKFWCKQAYASTGADYAEYFEWEDGNPENEDRRGYFVTMDGEKIRKAGAGDYILGIISGNPCIIGNTDMEWQGQFMRDEFGSFIKERHMEIITEPSVDEDGNLIEVEKEVEVEFYKVNPDYDPDTPYTFRDDRPEWEAVGMMGVLPVRDDGTCQVNGFCRCMDGGIATASETGYRVIRKISENIVKVVLK